MNLNVLIASALVVSELNGIDFPTVGVGTVGTRRYTLDEYQALDKPTRRLLRRAAFGDAKCIPHCAGVDLADLRAVLEAENERTGEFPEKWTDQAEDDETAYFLKVTK